MKKKSIRYTAGEIGKVKVVKDFLPPPDKLVMNKTHAKGMLTGHGRGKRT